MPRFIKIEEQKGLGLEEHRLLTSEKEIALLQTRLASLTKQKFPKVTPKLALEGWLDSIFGKNKKEEEVKKTYDEQIADLIEKLKNKTFNTSSKEVTGILAVFKTGERLIKGLEDFTALGSHLPEIFQGYEKTYHQLCVGAQRFINDHNFEELAKTGAQAYNACRPTAISRWRISSLPCHDSSGRKNIVYINSDQTMILWTDFIKDAKLSEKVEIFDFFTYCDFPFLCWLDYGVHPVSKASGDFNIADKGEAVVNALIEALEMVRKLNLVYAQASARTGKESSALYAGWEKLNETYEKEKDSMDSELSSRYDDVTSGIYGLMNMPYQHIFTIEHHLEINLERIAHAVLAL